MGKALFDHKTFIIGLNKDKILSWRIVFDTQNERRLSAFLWYALSVKAIEWWT